MNNYKKLIMNDSWVSAIIVVMNIIAHDTSPFTSQLLPLMFKKAVMGVSDDDYSLNQSIKNLMRCYLLEEMA